MKKLIIIFILSIAGQNSLLSEIFPSVYFTTGNVEARNDSTLESLYILGSDFGVEFPVNDRFFTAFDLSVTNFLNLPELNYLEPTLKFQYALNPDDSIYSLNLYGGSGAKLQSSTDLFTNTYSSNLGIQMMYPIDETRYINASSSIRGKIFSNLNQYNYIENINSVNYGISFESKTSLRFDARIQNKLYQPYDESIYDISADETQKKGSGNSTKIVTRYYLGLSIAQNLFEKTGINVYGKFSDNINSYRSGSSFLNYDYAVDPDLYNDIYSYQSIETGLKLTQVLPEEIHFVVSAELEKRNYYQSELMDGLFRDDLNYSINLSAEKNYEFEGFISGLNLMIYYQYSSNQSNISYFNYNTGSIFLGIGLSF